MAPVDNEKRLKGVIQIYLKFLEELNSFVDDDLANAKLSVVRLRRDDLVARHSEFLKFQSNLEAIDDAELEGDTRTTVDRHYYKVRAALDDRMEEFKDKKPPSSIHPIDELNFLPKLPDLTLEKFSGDLTKWQSFIESFNNHVHNNSRLSEITKFQYLKNLVHGPAAKPFENLDFVSANYEEARRLLMERFDRPNIIAEEHIRSLFTIKSITKPTSINLLGLLDEFNSHLRSLKTMGRPTDYWGDLIVHLMTTKFDPETKAKWRDAAPVNALPTLDDIANFIRLRSHKLDGANLDTSQKPSQTLPTKLSKPQPLSNVKSRYPQHSFHTREIKTYHCVHCNQSGHSLLRCHTFLSYSSIERRKLVDDMKLCSNCLRTDHTIKQCPVKDVCRICREKHHTLLHISSPSSISNSSPKPSSSSSAATTTTASLLPNTSTSSSTPNLHTSRHVILATALVEVFNKFGSPILARALLDSGSQVHFMTESLSSKLGIVVNASEMNIRGIACSTSRSCKSAIINLRSRFNHYSKQIEVLILPKITDEQPSFPIDHSKWSIPANLQLADPQYWNPSKIDLLLGADLFFELQSIGQIRLGNDLPVLQNTMLGWIISGKTGQPSNSCFSYGNLASTGSNPSENTDRLLEKFWDLDQQKDSPHPDGVFDNDCDRFFRSTHYRDLSGRFIVKLPLNKSSSELGDSYLLAKKRFLNLEKRLDRTQELRHSYNEFMAEYIKLDHMELIDPTSIETPNYYLPHHCVLKPDSSSTKLRVVFDGSAKSTSGISLNNILMPGPVVQNELFAIIIRFRAHAYAISADIAKMYRQVKVHESDQNLQQILWRFSKTEPLHTYKLKTVTYGTTSAPYLATRCLLQLALDTQSTSPAASSAIRYDVYVDDLLTGSNNLEDVMLLKTTISAILNSAGMPLRKWCANNSDVLLDVPDSDREQIIQIDEGEYVKTLGLFWQANLDTFHLKVNLPATSRITKRVVISEIAKIFDPIGLVSPIVVRGKIFMQTLWQLKVDWDESLSMQHHTYWSHFRNELQNLSQFSIPRHLFNGCVSPTRIQLHGFADASERAYGAVIYVRARLDDVYCVRLLCSKSRVAPLKKATLPRLELCAAQLLAKLVYKVKSFLNFNVEDEFYWSDSTITLCWLKSPSAKWKTFVSNRVSDIQNYTDPEKWHHIESKLNPADLISRGTLPCDLISSSLWWNGPQFLQKDDEFWRHADVPITIEDDISELRKAAVVLTSFDVSENVILKQVCEKSSFYHHIRNVMSYIYRYYHNLRFPAHRLNGPISSVDIENGTKLIVRLVQLHSFPILHKELQKPNPKIRDAALKSLSVFLDAEGIIRVGGRLQFSALSYSSRHPALLPNNHAMTLTILNFFHRQLLHVGPRGLLAAIRQQFWPVNGIQLAKQVCRQCVICSRVRPRLLRQQMAPLPRERLTMAPPFFNVGVDYAGPFYTTSLIRGRAANKTYLAVFVCLATKAVHLELASDLTTASFLGTFRRFVSTRGMCKRVFSDNATNFVGANAELHELYLLLHSIEDDTQFRSTMQKDEIQWSFQPPGSPHFGGLYEAAVKSCKYHLRRMMGNTKLTYEELNTLIKQVEAVLNSRPLTPLPSDNEFDVLTPGHFLIGRPLMAIPQPNLPDNRNINLLKRWELVDRFFQTFWTRWSKEYLQQLHHRYYWQDKSRNLPIGSIVLIHDENQPPLRWKLGRVIALHPGPDNLVRVVTVKTATGTLKRAINKLSPLPIDVEPPLLQGGENDNEQQPPS